MNISNSKGNSHSWDIFPGTWDMTPCFRATIPGSWVYILVKKFRSQVRMFGKNQVYLVEVITIFLFFDTLIFKSDLININNPRNLGMLPRNVDIICENIHPGSWDSCPKTWGHIPGFWEYIPGIALTVK